MKKVFLTVAAIFAMGVANAQEIKFGVKAGLNLSTLTGDAEDAKSLLGFHVGGLAEFKITDKFSVQPELLFSLQGAKTEYDYNDGFNSASAEEKLRLGYINVPVMAKFYVAPGFSLEAGPQVGFNVTAKNHYDYRFTEFGETVTESGKDDYKDAVETVDFAMNFGAGYEFTQNVFVQARYSLGLTNIAKDSDADVKNGVLQVSVGYKF